MVAVIFENTHCVAVDKPAGWLAVPGRTADDSRPILGRELEKQLGLRLLPIHRLDAEVSGLILYAKTPEFHRDANLAFEQHTVKKFYQAITTLGAFEPGDKRVWKSLLVRGKKRSFEAPHGKPSHTEALVLQRTRTHLEWQLHPITGRSHQLRFELTKHHCPIAGDSLYGSKEPWPAGGIALRSAKILFPQEMIHKWELPPEFAVSSRLNLPE